MVGRPALQLVSRTFDCSATLSRAASEARSPDRASFFCAIGVACACMRLCKPARFANSALQRRSRHVCARQLLPRHRGALAESTVLLIRLPNLGAQCAARRSCDGHGSPIRRTAPREYGTRYCSAHACTVSTGSRLASFALQRQHGTRRDRKKPGNAGLFPVLDHMRNARRTQVNKVCGYSGLRSRASNSFNPASGVISPCRTARTALEIGSSMPCCSA